MAVKYVNDFFDKAHQAGHAAFGFTGSSGTPDQSMRSDQGPSPGSTRGLPRQMPDGGMSRLHPDGHTDVMRTEKRFDGTYVEHHAHGGRTVHHLNGEVTHHGPNGSQVFCAGGSVGYKRGGKAKAPSAQDKKLVAAEHAAEMADMAAPPSGPPPSAGPPAGPPGGPPGGPPPGPPGAPPAAPPDQAPAGMKAGGRAKPVDDADDASDKAMVRSAVRQHEKHDHGGEYTDLQLKIGGTVRIPRTMTPAAGKRRSPIETPPRKPQVTRTPTNSMPGGVAPYGVQPSTEDGYPPASPTGAAPPGGALSSLAASPDDSGGMKRGGRAGK